jgi:hypothetical protein
MSREISGSKYYEGAAVFKDSLPQILPINNEIEAARLHNKQKINQKQQARKVFICFEFSKIGEIDTLNERYQAVFHIEIRWIEQEIIEKYEPDKHWNPKIYVENVFQEIVENKKYTTQPIPQTNYTLITESRRIKGIQKLKSKYFLIKF